MHEESAFEVSLVEAGVHEALYGNPQGQKCQVSFAPAHVTLHEEIEIASEENASDIRRALGQSLHGRACMLISETIFCKGNLPRNACKPAFVDLHCFVMPAFQRNAFQRIEPRTARPKRMRAGRPRPSPVAVQRQGH